jgi:hypothetical protein
MEFYSGSLQVMWGKATLRKLLDDLLGDLFFPLLLLLSGVC